MLPAGHACALERPPTNALGMAVHALSLLMQSRLVTDIRLHREDTRLTVLPPPCPRSISPIDFRRAGELIERSANDARAFLDRVTIDHPRKKPRAEVTKSSCGRLGDRQSKAMTRI